MRFLIIMYLLSILAGGTGGCTSQKGSKKSKSKKGNTSVTKAKKTREGVLADSKKEDESIVVPEDEDIEGNEDLLDRVSIEEFVDYKELTPEVQTATKEYVTKTDEFKTLVADLELDSTQEEFRPVVETIYDKLDESRDAFNKVYRSEAARNGGSNFFDEAAKVIATMDEVQAKVDDLILKDPKENEATKLEITRLTTDLNTMIQKTIGLLANKTGEPEEAEVDEEGIDEEEQEDRDDIDDDDSDDEDDDEEEEVDDEE